MQKIMIISDTHKKLGNFYEALERECDIDMLIDLGDFEGDEDIIREAVNCEVYMVAGNNDHFSAEAKELELEIAGNKILLTHGHYYYVSLDYATLYDEAVSREYDIIMFGHTHRPFIHTENGITLINPGSLSYPRQPDKLCTYIIMEVYGKDDIRYTLKSI